MINIAIVDDHPIVINGVKDMLATLSYIIVLDLPHWQKDIRRAGI